MIRFYCNKFSKFSAFAKKWMIWNKYEGLKERKEEEKRRAEEEAGIDGLSSGDNSEVRCKIKLASRRPHAGLSCIPCPLCKGQDLCSANVVRQNGENERKKVLEITRYFSGNPCYGNAGSSHTDQRVIIDRLQCIHVASRWNTGRDQPGRITNSGESSLVLVVKGILNDGTL